MKVTKKNFILVYSTFCILLILVGIVVEKVWSWHNQQELKKMAKQIIELPIDSIKQTDTNKYGILECKFGCPKYYSWDITGTHTPQTVIVLPTAMNHGAGKLIIVDKGKVIFESPELAQINVEPDNTIEENGFYLKYAEDIYTNKMTTLHYRYTDDEFVLQ